MHMQRSVSASSTRNDAVPGSQAYSASHKLSLAEVSATILLCPCPKVRKQANGMQALKRSTNQTYLEISRTCASSCKSKTPLIIPAVQHAHFRAYSLSEAMRQKVSTHNKPCTLKVHRTQAGRQAHELLLSKMLAAEVLGFFSLPACKTQGIPPDTCSTIACLITAGQWWHAGTCCTQVTCLNMNILSTQGSAIMRCLPCSACLLPAVALSS